MKKHIIAAFLTVAMLAATLFPVSALAAPDEEEMALTAAPAEDLALQDAKKTEAMKVVTDSISDLKGVLPGDDTSLDALIDIFKSAGETISSIVGPINGSLTFLKLIGLMEDSNAAALADIMNQLKSINDKLAEMDSKINDITAQMAAMQALDAFYDRTDKAMKLRGYWKSFKTNYMENSMDKLMSDYRAMLLNGMQSWCQNKSNYARMIGDVDNSQLILLYLPDEDGAYQIVFTTENGLPADFPENGRFLVLSPALLPDKITWNVNNYRESIQAAIVQKISDKANAGDFTAFNCYNYPEFTAAGSDGLTEELIEQTAADAMDLLSYRIAAGEVNTDASFSLEVSRLFDNYCTHLCNDEEGLDAIFKSLYLTHAFEYQIVDDFTNFCNEMALITGTYGAFAMNVMGMSDFITEKEFKDMETKYYDTLIYIGKSKEDGLTGDSHYCYITNSDIWLSEIDFYSDGVITMKKDGGTDAFVGASVDPVRITTNRDIGFGDIVRPANMLGGSNTLLMVYLLKFNGEDTSVDAIGKKIGAAYLNNTYPVITGFTQEESMPISGSFPLHSINVCGDYFPNNGTVSFSSLHKDAEAQYFRFPRRVQGDVCDLASAGLQKDKTLNAFAMYGENHWYWFHDEAAFVSGPTNTCESDYKVFPVTQKTVTTSDGPIIYYYHEYSQTLHYNGLLTVPAKQTVNSGSGYNPLASYRQMCAELWPAEEDPICRMDDVDHDGWYYDSVAYALDNGLMKGTSETTFEPESPFTRAMIVTILHRLEGEPAVESEPSFSDVSEGQWYTDAVIWANANGIVDGYNESRFGPEDNITREQFAAIIYRYAQYKKYDVSVDENANIVSYDDYSSVSEWALPALQWACGAELIRGRSDNMLAPKAGATRAEAATILMRFIEGQKQ
ncbi:MAG: S-layer homology domain-containing protein [Firmicutes bacterium]|nr:S-layer homology domain-containing protein [Bacillota bacterium]